MTKKPNVSLTSGYVKDVNGANVPARIMHMTPDGYRLARKPDGTLVLQGAYRWEEGNNYGHEWQDIPTVDVE